MDLPIFVLTLLLCQYVAAAPFPQVPEALVVTTTDINNDPTSKDESKNVPAPELDSMHVISNVSNRYAQTVISSRYKNPASVSQEATFSIVLPETAFISGFLMQIKDKSYEAYVREKEEAKKEYDFAVQQGTGAAHVAVNARDSNRFTVSMNIEPHSKVTFNLTYEELLVRKHGKYEMVVNLHPGQLVKDLTVDVYINETQPLVNVNTPAVRSGNDILEDGKKNEFAEINKIGDDDTAVHIHFAPSVKQQKQMAKDLGKEEDGGLAGQFLIEYDVERKSQGGEILVNDGYFVHFFAPPDLKTLPKYVVFVLDVSGSMYGRRIEQLRNAMEAILVQLGPNDYFNLVEFNSDVKILNINNIEASTILSNYGYYGFYGNEQEKPKQQFELLPAYPATAANIAAAQAIVKNMTADGGTNIYDALDVGLNMTAAFTSSAHFGATSPQPIIIFLTDGDPTVGNTSTNEILNIVAERNIDNKTAIFSLAFGSDTDKQLLKSVSLKHNGFMRQIYEASDAALQLQDFYKQIASPQLANVTFTYPDGDAVTQNVLHTYFGGSEFVVCGMMMDTEDKTASVHALTYDGPLDFIPKFIIPQQRKLGSLERLWAYTTIRQLLDKKDEIENDKEETEKKEIKEKALKLALKYSFVTSLTSLVVVKPNETQKLNTEEASAQRNDGYYGGFGGLSTPVNAGFAGVYSMSLPAAPFGGGGYSAGAAGFGFAGVGVPITYDDFDSDSVYMPEAVQIAEKTTVNTTDDIPSEADLPWLSSVIVSYDSISIDGKIYAIGNNSNSTYIGTSPCTVGKLSGNCTLLSACPQIYPDLDSFETYRTKYFCPLASNDYAGVCCVDKQEKVEEQKID